MFVIFDFDGTLSDCTHRIHLLGGESEEGRADWDEFYRQCVYDKPIVPIINTLTAFYTGGATIEIWTGRSDIVDVESRSWLAGHGVQPHLLKRMRPHGNHMNDADLKLQWLVEHGRTPDLVFEDRRRVVDMWRSMGIRTCHVDVGDF